MSKLIKIGKITVKYGASVLNDNRDYDVYADNYLTPPPLWIFDGPGSDAILLSDVDYNGVDYEWRVDK